MPVTTRIGSRNARFQLLQTLLTIYIEFLTGCR